MTGQTYELHARWQRNSYDVVLDAAPGTTEVSSVIAFYGQDMPTTVTTGGAAVPAPARPGYIFAGYYSLVDGQGTMYYDDQMASAHTWDQIVNSRIYAHWLAVDIPQLVTVGFDANGGIGAYSGTIIATVGSVVGTLESEQALVPTRAGYDFVGYYSQPTGGTMYYHADLRATTAIWSQEDDTATLYARWVSQAAQVLKVDFALQASDAVWEWNDTIDVVPGAHVPAFADDTPLPTLAGYDFLGFYNRAIGGTMFYNEQLQPSYDVWPTDWAGTRLYARWSPTAVEPTLESKLSYDINIVGSIGGLSEGYTNTVRVGLRVPALPEDTTVPTHPDYDFLGYFSHAQGGVRFYSATLHVSDAVWTIQQAEFTLIARWAPKPLSIIQLDANGGQGDMEIRVTLGHDMPAGLMAPTRDGHIFVGFYDDITDGEQYYDEGMIGLKAWDKLERNITLWARWEAVEQPVIEPPIVEPPANVLYEILPYAIGSSVVLLGAVTAIYYGVQSKVKRMR
jgi:hypothetical protein